jgi:hypothetical protein
MSGASWPVQVAVYEAVTAALDPVPVFDAVPQGQAKPYAVIGDDTAADWPQSIDVDGEEVEITVHVWSVYAGRKEVKTLMGRIRAALHEAPLAVPGFALVSLRCLSERSFLEPDGATRHGVIRFRAQVMTA